MAIKVPALLHKMSKSAQKAWYKKQGMEMPDEPVGRSAAAAKKVKVAPRKMVSVEPGSVRALNAAKQQAYMAKGGRQPIGAMGSGGSNVMAGAGQSTIKDLKASIKAGFNPKVSLDPYESERAKKTGPRSLKLKKESVNEANKPDASMVMTDQLKKKMISDKDKNTLGKIANLMANAKNKDKKNAYVRQVGLKAMKAGKVDPARGHSPTRFGREVLKKEEVEQVDEVTKKEAEAALGGPVKEKPKMSPGKQPAGYRYVRGLARKAMKAGMKKEEVEQIDEISPGLARKAAAASQVKAIEFSDYSGLSNLHNKEGKKEGRRLDRKSDKAMDYIKKRQGQKGVDKVNRMVTRVVGEEAEQVDEGKIAKALAVGAMSLASMGAKAHTDTTKSVAQLAAERPALAQRLKDIGATGQVPASDKRAAELQRKQDQEMPASERRAKELKKEEVNYIEEKLTAADPASKWISDFVKSDNPKFAGKSKKERIQQALGAYYAAKGNKNEQNEFLESKKMEKMEKEAEEDEIEDEEEMEDEDKEEKMDEATKDWKRAFSDVAQKNLRKDIGRVRSKVGRLNYIGMKPKVDATPKVTAAVTKKGAYSEAVEGKTPETATEVELAKKHGDPKKITYGDVIKARIASAKKKTLNKGE